MATDLDRNEARDAGAGGDLDPVQVDMVVIAVTGRDQQIK